MTSVLVAATAIGIGALLVWLQRTLGADSLAFAFLVVWLPMTWVGTISHVVRLRMPDAWHVLRSVEVSGRIYERTGVQWVKQMLRRGPFAVFNPGLHLPAEPTPEALARLEQRMRTAEASHVVSFMLSLSAVAFATISGFWLAAAVTLAFDLLINGYPVMLQRYNRALLHIRFGISYQSNGAA
jgi:Glycosyl-4,4'-diaponeurosporenoate acyltransferase